MDARGLFFCRSQHPGGSGVKYPLGYSDGVTSAADIDFRENWLGVGLKRPGYAVRVVNERVARGSAGILFALGLSALLAYAMTGWRQPLQMFAIFFLLDMSLRLFVTVRVSPTMALASVFVTRQQPEWVSAEQKSVAWLLGLIMAFTSCFVMGMIGAPALATILLCGVCLFLLFAETAFGFCFGCWLYRVVFKRDVDHCPGGVCQHSPRERE